MKRSRSVYRMEDERRRSPAQENLIVVKELLNNVVYTRLRREHLRIRASWLANCALIDRQPSRPSTA